MSQVIALPAFAERKAIGDAHELRVRGELERCGWAVAAWGQGILTESVTAALRRTDSDLRWTPDLIAVRDGIVCLIDAKARMSTHTRRHSVSRRCLEAHLRLMALVDLPIYYVFDTLGVLTPYDIKRFAVARIDTRFSGSTYLVHDRDARPFDSVFNGDEALFSFPLRAA